MCKRRRGASFTVFSISFWLKRFKHFFTNFFFLVLIMININFVPPNFVSCISLLVANTKPKFSLKNKKIKHFGTKVGGHCRPILWANIDFKHRTANKLQGHWLQSKTEKIIFRGGYVDYPKPFLLTQRDMYVNKIDHLAHWSWIN